MMEVVIGAVDLLGITGTSGHRIALGAIGVVTVVLVGLVAAADRWPCAWG